jgi:hypothetical protein
VMTSNTIQPIRGAELRKPATDAVIHYLGDSRVRCPGSCQLLEGEGLWTYFHL